MSVAGILLIKLLNVVFADMDMRCCSLPVELRVKILYYLRFDSEALVELKSTKAFHSLVVIKDSYGNALEKITYKPRSSYLQKYLYRGSVKHLFTVQEYFPNTWALRCVESPDVFLFTDDDSLGILSDTDTSSEYNTDDNE